MTSAETTPIAEKPAAAFDDVAADDVAASAAMTAAHRVLRQKFDFSAFRPGQAEAIGAVLRGEDVVALYPTGAGKSLIYQLPALMRPGLVLVVSPLVALMRDQIDKMRALQIPAAALHAGQTAEERKALTRDLAAGVLKMLYLAPERLALPETLELLAGVEISLLAIDEAHCVSHWGHDFRPEYLHIRSLADQLGVRQILALTATATPATRADMIAHLFHRTPTLRTASLRRVNLSLAARPRHGDGHRQILRFIAAHPGQSGVVYCASRAVSERLAEFLRGAGVEALAYHAGLPGPERTRRQHVFLARDDLVMTATIAFGLGVDKANLRYILHLDAPERLESLYQESGRAGRDGLPAEALALFSPQRRSGRDEASAEYYDGLVCREQSLLAHLGETVAPCGHCDNCRRGRLEAGLLQLRRALRAAPQAALFWLDRLATRPAPEPGAEPLPELAVTAPQPPAPEAELTVFERRRYQRLRSLRQICAREARLAPARLAPDDCLIAWAKQFSGDGAAGEKRDWDHAFDQYCAAQAPATRAALQRHRDGFWRQLTEDAADPPDQTKKAFRE